MVFYGFYCLVELVLYLGLCYVYFLVYCNVLVDYIIRCFMYYIILIRICGF